MCGAVEGLAVAGQTGRAGDDSDCSAARMAANASATVGSSRGPDRGGNVDADGGAVDCGATGSGGDEGGDIIAAATGMATAGETGSVGGAGDAYEIGRSGSADGCSS